MKKIIYLFISFLILTTPVYATAIQQGGVSYTVDSARDYVQEGQQNSIEISGPYEFSAKNTEKVVYSYNNSGEVIGITVQYINEPTKAYIYGRNKTLIFIDKYDKPVNIYPHRGYRYDMDGKLNLSSLTVSKNEMFRFSPSGKLIAHSLNGITYDEVGNVIGTAK